MRVLPKERYVELTERIKEIQRQFPLKKWQLADAYSKLERWVEENSVPIYMEEIKGIKVFGLLSYSPTANAYDLNTREWLSYHGDIYCEIWSWSEENGKLVNMTAWGGISERNLAVVHQPLIEFP